MKRGWCPGVHEPMPSGDGLLIRVKPFGGRLEAAALLVIAAVAEECGNGIIELTSRGNIQLRGLSDANVPAASAALIAAGLADADPARERRRNVIAAPPCDDALVARIEAMLAEIEGLAAKFCVAVGDATADIVVRDGMVGAGGIWEACAAEDMPEAVRRIAMAAGGRRLGSLIPSWPGLTRPSTRFGEKDAGDCEAERPASLQSSCVCGRVEPGNDGENVLISLPFGQTDATALRGLARLIGGHEIRTTPWRAFWLPGAHDPAPFAAIGFITDANDPRLRIAACPGAPSCASATVATRADAAFLASLGIRDVHVSGCAKGCAHHRAAVTLVGVDGRYDLVRHGRAGDAPDARGLTIGDIAELLG